MEEKIKDSEIKKLLAEKMKKTTMSDEQPKFKQEFYGQFVTNPKYEVYSATQFYLMLRNKSNEKPMISMSRYKELGGWWLVEFIDNMVTDYWRFDFRHQANYWKREKEQTQGKAKIVSPNPYK